MNNISVCEDSSIFLAELFENKEHKSYFGLIDKCQQKFNFEKCISPTIKKEMDCRVTDVVNFLGDVLKEFNHYFLKIKTKNIHLSNQDLICRFFTMVTQKYNQKTTETELLCSMWLSITKHIQTLTMPQNIDDFASDCADEIIKQGYLLQRRFDIKCSNYKIFSVVINPKVCQKLNSEPSLKKTTEKKPNDIVILCEVEAYQKSLDGICLLATVDSDDFLDNTNVIKRLVGVKCVHPRDVCREFEVI